MFYVLASKPNTVQTHKQHEIENNNKTNLNWKKKNPISAAVRGRP